MLAATTTDLDERQALWRRAASSWGYGGRYLVQWTAPLPGETWIDLADAVIEAARDLWGDDAADAARDWIRSSGEAPPWRLWRLLEDRVAASMRARWLAGEAVCVDARGMCAALLARPPSDLVSADADVDLLRRLAAEHRAVQRDAASVLLVAPVPPARQRLDGHDGALAAFMLAFPC